MSSGESLLVASRWAEATSGGWADLLVNFQFTDGPAAGHVCEIQYVHSKLMIVRKQMGAHHEYAVSRAAMELLEMPAPMKLTVTPPYILPSTMREGFAVSLFVRRDHLSSQPLVHIPYVEER